MSMKALIYVGQIIIRAGHIDAVARRRYRALLLNCLSALLLLLLAGFMAPAFPQITPPANPDGSYGDSAGVTLTPDVVSVREGEAETYTVELASRPTANVTVAIGVPDGAGLTADVASLTFTPGSWDTAQIITITADEDADAVTDTATLAHEASGATEYGSVTGNVSVTITDTDTAGVSVSRAAVTIAEADGTTDYTVVLNTQPSGTVEITVTPDAGAATVDTATTAGLQSTLTFTADNWNQAQTVTVTSVNDAIDNGEARTVVIRHAITTGDYPLDRVIDSVMVRVTDDDTAGVSVSRAAVTVAEAGGTDSYTVVLDTQPTTEVEITVNSDARTRATVDTATTAGLQNTLTFTSANWDQVQMVTITGVNDDVDNADGERVEISHVISRGDYGVDIASVTVRVRDDEAPAMLVLTKERIELLEGGSDSYSIRLMTAPTAAVTVTISEAPSQLQQSASSLTFTPTDWNQSQTVTLTAVADGDTTDNQVRLTHVASGGGYDSVRGEVDVFITDTGRDAGVLISEPRLTMIEGAIAEYTVMLDAPPMGTETVTLTVTSDHTGMFTVEPPSRTFTAADWNRPQVFTVMSPDDEIGSAPERMDTIVHEVTSSIGGTGYSALEEQRVEVRIRDDEDDAGLMLMRGGEPVDAVTVIEGEASLTYTVSLTSQPTADVTIEITGDSGTNLRLSSTRLTFTSRNWDMPQAWEVSAVTDDDAQPDTVKLNYAASTTATDDGYGNLERTVMVSIADRENMQAGVRVSPTELRIAENGTTRYHVKLNAPPPQEVVVTATSESPTLVQVSRGEEPADSTLDLVFSPMNWGIEQAVTLTGVGRTDNPVMIRHAIANPVGDYRQDLEIDSVRVTVAEDEEPVMPPEPMQTAQMAEIQTAQQSVVPGFGAVVTDHVLGGLDYRFSVADGPGSSGGLNNLSRLFGGQSPNAAAGGNGAGAGAGVDGFGKGVSGVGDSFGAGSVDRLFDVSRSLSLSEVLRDSRFLSGLGEQSGISVWGQASYSSYEDQQDGVSVDIDATTAMLGVDRDTGETLLGLALAYSDGEGDWKGTLGEGKLSSTLLSLLPYMRHDVSERLQIWGAVSYGEGDLEQTSKGATREFDLKQISASFGARGKLLERSIEEGGLTLTLTSEATLARTETDNGKATMRGTVPTVMNVEGTTSDTERLRLGLEWSWQLPQADGVRLVPELELGVRYDGGDTREGIGIELGGGISWELPASGLTIDLRGRHLLEHEASERREWGISGSLRYDLQPGSSHGPSLSLRHEYGNSSASSGLDQLLSGSLSDSVKGQELSEPGEVSSSWSLEGEWGVALEDGDTGIGYAGLSSSGDKRDLTLGWRLLSASNSLDTELDIKVLRREEEEGNTSHSIGAELKLRW